MSAVERAVAADLPAIAALHVDSWRRFYRDDVPAEALGPGLDLFMAEKWTDARLARLICLVVRDGAGLAGFVACDPADPAGPLLDNLHVAAAAQGRGLGRALMQAVAAELIVEGHGTMWLTVLEGNARARAAYRAWGGAEGPPEPGLFLNAAVSVRTVSWHDLVVLVGPLQCAATSDRFGA